MQTGYGSKSFRSLCKYFVNSSNRDMRAIGRVISRWPHAVVLGGAGPTNDLGSNRHLAVPAFASGAFDSKTSEMSTIVAFVKMLASLLKQPEMESTSCPS
jgi:hypothetical protein